MGSKIKNFQGRTSETFRTSLTLMVPLASARKRYTLPVARSSRSARSRRILGAYVSGEKRNKTMVCAVGQHRHSWTASLNRANGLEYR